MLPHGESDVMVLDAQTFKDLEVFESTVEGASLFDLCNHTRSKSGGKALRERMKRPWSSPARIRSVQISLQFMLANRAVFERLPTYVITQIVKRYFEDTRVGVLGDNALDFGIGILDLMYSDPRRYYKITQGVGVTATLIHTLRQMVYSSEFATLQSCELLDIIGEMRELLAHQALRPIDDQVAARLGMWGLLRTDQVFRIHEKLTILRLLQLSYELDALLSMAEATRKLGFFMPHIKEGPLFVAAEGLVHPLVANAVANPVDLDQQRRLLFLTGPNMAGKTTYLRAVAVMLYFAHLGMGVPARSMSFVPAQKLFSSITLADNLHAGVSFFRAEGLRVKAIAQALADGYRVIALMDEPFKGTNVKDALDASSAILERFAAKEGSLFMFSSHLIELCEALGKNTQVDCRYFEAGEQQGKLSFEYNLQQGVSRQRLGMRVLQEEGIFDLLDGNSAANASVTVHETDSADIPPFH